MKVNRKKGARRPLPHHFGFPLLGSEEIGDVEKDDLVVVGTARFAAHRTGIVVVVGDNDGGLIDAVDIFDGDEREVEDTLDRATRSDAIGILDVHEVDIGDLFQNAVFVGAFEIDKIDALELGGIFNTLVAGVALAAVALDDQGAGCPR